MLLEFAESRTGFRVLAGVILLLAVGLRLYGLGFEVFWLDEILSLRFSDASTVRELIRTTAVEDRTPPLYYLMLRYWRLPFQGPEWTRLLSAVGGIGCVAVTGVLAFMVGGRSMSLATLLLMAVSQYQVYYSQEARVYAWLALACVSSWVLLIRAVSGPTSRFRWIAYASVTVCGIYLHHTFWFSVIAQVLWFLKRHVRAPDSRRTLLTPFAVTGASVLLASLPVVYLLKWQSGAAVDWWVPPLSLIGLFFAFQSMACGIQVPIPLWATALCLSLAVVCWVRFAFSQRGDPVCRSAILWATLVPFVVMIAASFYRSVILFGQRYLIVIQPFFVAGLAGGILALPRWVSRASVVTVLVVWGLLLHTTYTGTEKRRYDVAASVIAKQSKPQDRLLVVPDTGYTCLAFFQTRLPPKLDWKQEDWRDDMVSALASGGRIWAVVAAPEMTPYEGDVLRYAEPKLFSVIAERPFLRIVRYEKR